MPEEVINQAIALIDLLEAKIIADAGNQISPSLPGFDPAKSAGIAGIVVVTCDVKAKLLALIPEL